MEITNQQNWTMRYSKKATYKALGRDSRFILSLLRYQKFNLSLIQFMFKLTVCKIVQKAQF